VPVLNKIQLKKFRKNYTVWDGKCVTEGIRLAVHFDEKDDVKQIRARWQPAPNGEKGGYWWLPCKEIYMPMPNGVDEIINVFERDDNASTSGADGLSRLEWLNRNKMVNGFHGAIQQDAALDAIKDVTAVEHHIRNPENDEYGHFYVFADEGVVNWTTNGANPNYNHTLMTVEEGHLLWASLMAEGYRPVLEESS
jgi:hypothetical protein